MPKVTQEHLDARRAEILDGARRAFAEHGYEGATVARLEEATGLSRGAIFHYFENKNDLFVELAMEMNTRFGDILVAEGLDEAFRELSKENPEWLAVLIETESRMRHDEDFVRRLEAKSADASPRIQEWFTAAAGRGEASRRRLMARARAVRDLSPQRPRAPRRGRRRVRHRVDAAPPRRCDRRAAKAAKGAAARGQDELERLRGVWLLAAHELVGQAAERGPDHRRDEIDPECVQVPRDERRRRVSVPGSSTRPRSGRRTSHRERSCRRSRSLLPRRPLACRWRRP